MREEKLPSWGRRRSAMSSREMILMRETTARWSWRGISRRSKRRPSRGDRTDVEAEVDLESVVEALGGHDLGDLAVRLLDRLLDGAGRPDAEIDLEAGGAPEVVHGHDVQRVGSGDDEPPARALRRDHPVLPGHFFGHELDDVGVEGGQVLTGDGVFAKLRAEVLEQDVLVDQLHVDEDLTQPLSGLALPLEGLVELLGGQKLVVDEHLAQRAPRPAIGCRAHSFAL